MLAYKLKKRNCKKLRNFIIVVKTHKNIDSIHI